MDNDVARGIIIFFFGCLGVVLAGLMQVLYEQGILIDEYITNTISLPDAQIIMIILALLVGCVIAIIKK